MQVLSLIHISIYNANADIQNVEFINNKNGIVVEWKFDENEHKESIASPDSSDWVRVNSNYLVRHRAVSYTHLSLSQRFY